MPSDSPSRRVLLLFDIDGTLITSGGAGEKALCQAMEDRFGVPEDLKGITLAGATDALIARLMLEKNGIQATPENITGLLDAYLRRLSERMSLHQGRLLPGIVSLLDRLKQEPSCIIALLTGNLVKGAEIKLSHYGVWDYFEFGAFADDHHDRNQLGHFARSRATEAHGIDLPARDVCVIGDTPRDIECGKAIGARTVAIGTGNYSLEDLAAHEPDHLFVDLSDTEAVVSALLGHSAA